MQTKFPSLLASIFVTGLIFAALAAAQTATGELSITVLDPSSAVVPNASVTVAGSDTGATVRTLASNERGIASVALLPAGNYDISLKAAGFKTAVRRGVTLSAGSVVSLSITLETGVSAESITVVGEAPLLEEKAAALGQVISAKQMIDLPLNGRNYLALANLTPGAVPSNGSRDQTFSAYGNSGLQNAFLLDGARNENYLRGLDNRARDMIRPPLDALAEFTVQTSNFSAEYGAAAGGVVSTITKSGTNTLHGSAYEFLRNDNLDATNFFAGGVKPLLVRNQYGGSLGGPVRKDRVWVFGAYEGLHLRNETTSSSTVPTAAMHSANFGPTAIYDPDTTRANPAGSGYVRDPFPGSTIPTARLNSIGVKEMNLYPAANVPGSSTLYRRNVPLMQDNKNGVVRGDYQLTSNDTMFGRYSRTQAVVHANAGLPAPAQLPVNRDINSSSAGYGYTRTLTSTLINEFRFTWTTIEMFQDGILPRDEIIAGSLDSKITSGTPTFNVSNYAGLGTQPGDYGNSPLRKSSGVWDMADNVSKNMGAHVLKFGTEWMLIRPSTFAQSNGRGSFGFSGVFTQNPQGRSGTGNAAADLLLGYANSLTTGSVAENVERGWFGSGYVQDQWTVNRQLTLNIGVRYEYSSPYAETQNRLANFILDDGDPLYGKLIQAGDKARPRPLIYGDGNNWSPRFGFAWRVPKAKDLVLRGSYGIFYGQDQGTGVTNRMTSNPPSWGYGAITISSDQLFPSSGYMLNPAATISRPAPISQSAFVLVPSATAGVTSWPTHPKTPYVQQWSFSIQKQLPGGLLAELNYVGNHGVQLIGIGEGNQPKTLAATTVVSRRPLSAYTVASAKALSNWNLSSYNGLSMKLERRFGAGVSFLTTFTWGHALDFQDSSLDLTDNGGGGDTLQDNYYRRNNWASGDNDIPWRYVLAGSFDSPVGKGKRYLSQNRVGSAIAGGWRLAAIYQTQSGQPKTPGLSFDAANAGTPTRPNRVCDGNLSNGTVAKYIDTSCFVVPASYTFGNSGRNVLRTPKTNNVDLSLQRDFRIMGERAPILQLRLESFNALNHTQFAGPGLTVGSATYGMITSTRVDARQLQAGVRLSF